MPVSVLRKHPVAATIASAVILLGCGLAVRSFVWSSPQEQDQGPSQVIETLKPSGGDEQQTAAVVTLAEGKLTSAHLHVEPATVGALTLHHFVPGRLAYDDNRHIEVKSPTNGIVTEVHVTPGDVVQAGDVLATLASPEIGTARADILQRQAQAQLSQKLSDRAETLQQNVTALVAAIKQAAPFDELEQQFADKLLGEDRNLLLGAYSRMQLAQSVQKNSATLSQSGALSGKVAQERQAEARAARAALDATCEQSVQGAWLNQRQAEADANDARRRLEIAQQHLSALLLSDAAIHPQQHTPTVAELGASDANLEALSTVAVRAPFGGTIEQRMLGASERVQPGNTLFVLADTKSLWMMAEIRENDWPAVSLRAGQTLTVTVPALNEVELSATIEYVGREVSPDTNAVPIVATIDNAQGRLRPGLFVRVAIPITSKNEALTVPASAVLHHDGAAFVFEALDANHFRRVDVVTGEAGDGRIEIIRGLHDGDLVVTQGAFFLKSELLLETVEK